MSFEGLVNGCYQCGTHVNVRRRGGKIPLCDSCSAQIERQREREIPKPRITAPAFDFTFGAPECTAKMRWCGPLAERQYGIKDVPVCPVHGSTNLSCKC